MKEKIKIQKKLIRFLFVLLFLLFLVLSFHLLVKFCLGKDVFSNRIIWSYLLNFCLGYASYIVLILSLKKYVTTLGFIFMYISFAKLIVFYVVFKPGYSLNGGVDIGDFLTIMIPYASTLIVEIYSISKVLKN